MQYVDRSHFLEDTIGENQVFYYTFNVPHGISSLRTTLVWDDPEAQGTNDESTAYERKLVNDLDLYLIPPNQSPIARPWVLDHGNMHGTTVPGDGIDSINVNGVLTKGLIPDSIKVHPAFKGIDTLNNVEVVDVNNPLGGNWIIAVVARDLQVAQSISPDMKQDFSLVFDFPVSPDTTCGDSRGHDAYGLIFGNTSGYQTITTQAGDFQLRGSQKTGSLSGLQFGSAVSIDNNGNLFCNSITPYQAAWLDNSSNLTGGLVLGRPDGTVYAHLASSGDIKIKKRVVMEYGTF